jgi:hypothetical protein
MLSSQPVRTIVVSVIAVSLLMARTAQAESVVNPSFDAVSISVGDYAYQSETSGYFESFNPTYFTSDPQEQNFIERNMGVPFGWIFNGATGLTTDGSSLNPPTIPDGGQAAFIQFGSGSTISQTIDLLASPYYTLSFLLGGRQATTNRYMGQLPNGNQTVNVQISDGADVVLNQNVATHTGSPITQIQFSFAILNPGAYTVTFSGTEAGNSTAFLDDVLILTPEPSTIALFLMAGGLLCALRRKV